jgi:hypothetical protein
MRVHLLLVLFVPGLAFPATGSAPEADPLPASQFSAAGPGPKATLLPGTTSFDVASSTLRTSTLPVSPAPGVVQQGTILVVPDNEDRPAPEKNRWAKFEEALGPGRSANSRFRTYGWRNNDGTRVECYAPCVINCCVSSGGFSTTGDGFGL